MLTQLLQEDMDDTAALEAYGEAALALGQVKAEHCIPNVASTTARCGHFTGTLGRLPTLRTRPQPRPPLDDAFEMSFCLSAPDRNVRNVCNRQVDDALKIFLRLIVAQSENKDIRRFLARTLKSPGGLKQLREHLPDQESSASALAFLATVVKDHSGADEAIDIYEQVMRL